MKTLSQIREASGGKEAYQKFFNSLLKKFGVDSPSELKGDKKNKFFNAVDKGWDGSGEKAEATIHISNEITEKLKPGKGKETVGTDVDWDNVGDEKKWIKQAKSKYKVTIKKDVGKYHSGASISGEKANIIKFLQGPMYGGVEDRDIEDMWPWLLEATIHISNELFNEAVKAGKGSIKNVDIDLDASDYDGGEKQYIKDVKKRFKVTIKLHRNGAYLTGKKADIIQFLLSDMYGGLEDDDIGDLWPELLEAFTFFKKKKKPGKVNVKPGRGNAKMDIDKDAMDNVKKGADKKHGITMRPRGDEIILSGPKDKLLSFVTQELGWDKDDVEMMWPDLLESQPDDQSDEDVPDDRGNYHGVEEAHNGHVDDESPKKKVDDDEGNYSGVEEEAPPGMEDVVLKLKADGKSDEEAFKIAWSIYNNKKSGSRLHLSKKRGERYYYDSVNYDEAAKWGPAKKGKSIKGAKFGKSHPVMDQGQRKKIIAIAKKNSGNMQKAMKEIEKLKKGMTDNPAVMDILRKANESLDLQRTGDTGSSKSVKEASRFSRELRGHAKQIFLKTLEKIKKEKIKGDRAQAAAVDDIEGAHLLNGRDKRTIIKALAYESVQEGVSVDRRTLGFKDAMIRNEKAKKVREKAKLKKEKKKEQEILDARYEYDGEVDTVLANANKALFGETASNAVAAGGVDMAPNAGKKKKDKFKVVKRPNY